MRSSLSKRISRLVGTGLGMLLAANCLAACQQHTGASGKHEPNLVPQEVCLVTGNDPLDPRERALKTYLSGPLADQTKLTWQPVELVTAQESATQESTASAPGTPAPSTAQSGSTNSSSTPPGTLPTTAKPETSSSPVKSSNPEKTSAPSARVAKETVLPARKVTNLAGELPQFACGTVILARPGLSKTGAKLAEQYPDRKFVTLAAGSPTGSAESASSASPTVTAHPTPETQSTPENQPTPEPSGANHSVPHPHTLSEIAFDLGQAAFLAGYAASGVTQSGQIGVVFSLPQNRAQTEESRALLAWAGQETANFARGIEFYNSYQGSELSLHGYRPETQTISPLAGKALAQEITRLQQAGCDYLLWWGAEPTAAQWQQLRAKQTAVIWVGEDGYRRFPTEKGLVFTSLLVEAGNFFTALEKSLSAGSSPQDYRGDLKAGGVRLAEFHDYAPRISPQLKKDLDSLITQLKTGALKPAELRF